MSHYFLNTVLPRQDPVEVSPFRRPEMHHCRAECFVHTAALLNQLDYLRARQAKSAGVQGWNLPWDSWRNRRHCRRATIHIPTEKQKMYTGASYVGLMVARNKMRTYGVKSPV